MIAGIWGLLQASGLATRLIAFAVAAAALLIAYGVWHHAVYAKGYQAALADIARADASAVAKATQYRGAFKDCRAAGRAWDQTTGACR
jgi:hypothetical protein